MAWYREMEETTQLEDFPKIDVKSCIEFANGLFKPYLFIAKHKDEIELHASCCMKKGSMPYLARTMTETEYGIIYGKHNDTVVCPYCGKRATLKEISHLGKKKKILEYVPIIFLTERDGDLYARAYWAMKDYQGALEAPPLFAMTAAYNFSIGKATVWTPNYGLFQPNSIQGNYDPVHRVITEPFTDGNFCYYRYLPYAVCGEEAIEKSKFKYCGYETFMNMYRSGECDSKTPHTDMMKFLAACSIYPRQIEMLMKSEGKGFRTLVADLVIGRSKNSKIIDWKQEDIRKGLDLTKQEIREYLQSRAGIYSIAWYKYCRKKGLKISFDDVWEIHNEMPLQEDKMFRLCAAHKIKPTALVRYLNGFTGPRCGGMGYMSTETVFGIWKDYVNFAGALGWDLKEETVLLPKDLEVKHTQASTEYQMMQTQKEKEDAEESLRPRRKKYNVELDGYFIRIAESSEEIIREGKTLQHCVGGYAHRHMEGKTTILFLRRTAVPEASLYTIEMDGNRLVQIHGFKNEWVKGQRMPDPKETMAWMLEPWLAWLKAGSPRDKENNPKMEKFIKKVEEASA